MAGQPFDFDAAIAAEVAKQMQNQQVAGQPTPSEISFNVKGQKYEYKTPKELEEAVNYTVDTYQSEIERLKKLVEEQNSTHTEPEPTVKEEDDFSKEEYIRLMDEDPRKAQDYVDSYRYGVDNPVETVKRAAQLSESNQRLLDVNQFKSSHPEFQASPQGAQILQSVMQENGWDFNYKNLEASLAVAQQRGLLPNQQQYREYIEQQRQAQNPPQWGQEDDGYDPPQYQPPYQQQQTFQPQPGVGWPPQPNQQPWQNSPPPRTGQNTGGMPSTMASAEDLSIEQLETILKNAGHPVR